MILLSLEAISTFYGSVQALHDASLEVHENEIVTLIGANGAGKSTLLMTVCGNPQARSGTIVFDGKDTTRLPTHEIARLGLAQVPEGRRIFPKLSVRENLTLGGRLVDKKLFRQNLEKILARLPRLNQRLDQPGGTLSGGEQQMLAIGRALMGNPRLLLLDEPSLGLAPLLIKQVFALLAELNREEGVTILLVEQNATAALRLANRGYVLVNGRITLSGTGEALLADPAVRAAYLEGGVGAQ
jgi:branched-chain amino acid transport system ATP-binding protein